MSSFLSRLFRLYKLIWEQLNWPFPASAHIVYGIYVYMFKISQIKIWYIYLFGVLANDRVTNWQSGQYQCWSHGNKSSRGIGPLRIDLRIPRKLNILMFLLSDFYWGWTIFFQSHLKGSSIPNKWFEKIWTNCARWIKWSGAKLCVDKIQTAINHL